LSAANKNSDLNFVAVATSIAFGRHQGAQLAYSVGHRELGDRARDGAITAYSAAEQVVELLEVRPESLAIELQRLASALEAYYPEQFSESAGNHDSSRSRACLSTEA
jgi:hypothetical protein